MPASDIEREFPALRGSDYQITSPKTSDYNCFAWALHTNDEWYSPVSIAGYYWPPNLSRNAEMTTMLNLFHQEGGFEPCEDGSFEEGFEKIALYFCDGIVTHAARQLSSGRWTSKLGSMEDIEHSLEMLEGDSRTGYGKIARYLKRPK